MSIKKLQNNFTTPEQSKQLLELGVPVYSADCVYIVYDEGTDKEYYTLSIPMPHQSSVIEIVENGNKDYAKGNVTFYYCWSVGRLIEIYHICNKSVCSFSFNVCFPNLINEMIYKIVEAKKHGWIDFSKLNELYLNILKTLFYEKIF